MKKTSKILKSARKILSIIILFFIVGVFSSSVLFAQETTGPRPASQTTTIGNPFSGGDDLNALIVTILKNVIMPIAAVASVIYIIWAGFQYVMAQGNPGKISEANKNLLYALIGVGVLLGAVGISEVVQNTVKSVVNLN